MISEQNIQLINAGADGELTPAERRTLEELLASSPEARKYWDELRSLVSALDQVPDVQAPGDLKSTILAQLSEGEMSSQPIPFSDRKSSVRSNVRRRRERSWMAPGLAMAASLVLVVGLTQWLVGPMDSVDLDQVSGSIVQARSNPGDLVINIDELTAHFTFDSGEGSLALNIELDSAGPVSTVIEVAEDSGYEWSLPKSEGSQLFHAAVDGTLLRIEGQGSTSLNASLNKAGPVESAPDGTGTAYLNGELTGELKVQIWRGSRLVHEADLTIPDQN